MRKEILARRDAEPERAARSGRVVARVLGLAEFAAAGVVAAFIGVRSEVETDALVTHGLGAGKRIVLPRVVGNDLELIAIRSMDELIDAAFGLREPAPDLAAAPDRVVDPDHLDLLLVPGVAFDRGGGRLGHGRGYYDRLLGRVHPAVPRVGLAFECQLVERVPMEPWDERMDLIVTERSVYRVTPSRLDSADL